MTEPRSFAAHGDETMRYLAGLWRVEDEAELRTLIRLHRQLADTLSAHANGTQAARHERLATLAQQRLDSLLTPVLAQ